MTGAIAPDVAQAYDALPDAHRPYALQLRTWILEEGASVGAAGGIEETLKWGEPSYLPVAPRVGTTVRVGAHDGAHVALYVSCQTTLVDSYRARFGDALAYSKTRAVLFPLDAPLPEDAVRTCVRMALEYHVNKRRGSAR